MIMQCRDQKPWYKDVSCTVRQRRASEQRYLVTVQVEPSMYRRRRYGARSLWIEENGSAPSSRETFDQAVRARAT